MKPEFYTELSATAIPPNRWRLDKPLHYLTLVTGKPEDIIAESGFDTDLASIPRLLRWLIPGNGIERPAATLHDKVYRTGGYSATKKGTRLTRKQCDQILLEANLVDIETYYRSLPKTRMNWLKKKNHTAKAYLIYNGVRSGGWITFNRNRRRYKTIHGLA